MKKEQKTTRKCARFGYWFWNKPVKDDAHLEKTLSHYLGQSPKSKKDRQRKNYLFCSFGGKTYEGLFSELNLKEIYEEAISFFRSKGYSNVKRDFMIFDLSDFDFTRKRGLDLFIKYLKGEVINKKESGEGLQAYVKRDFLELRGSSNDEIYVYHLDHFYSHVHVLSAH